MTVGQGIPPHLRCEECGWLTELGHAQHCESYANAAQDYADEAWERETER